eukprot:gene11061-19920_t
MATKRKFYKSKFSQSWTEEYPVRAVSGDPYKFYCIPCGKKLSCDHQGVKDVSDHCKKDSHKANVESSKSQSSMKGFLKSNDSKFDEQVLNAEVMMTNFLVQHNISLLTADHLSSLFKEVFPDSKIAKKYAARRTKTTAILNKSLAPHCLNYIEEHCKVHPYSVGTDGSNDTGIEKMNPICVKIFDVNRSRTVTTHFLDMCVTSGVGSATAEGIFTAIEEVFENNRIPWENCVSLSVDNTNTMIGKNNSIASRFLEKSQNVFIAGCPCHLAHIAASNSHDAFSEYIGLNIENFMVDLFYWFKKTPSGRREEPTIYILKPAIESLGKKLAKRIMHPSKVKCITNVSEIDLNDSENFIETEDIYLGVLTKRTLKKLLDEGDISEQQYKDLHDAVHYYFKLSLQYMKKKFPLNNPLICNAVWVNVPDRINSKWAQVQYFFDLYPNLMSAISADELYEEFTDYQTLNDNDFEERAWEEARVSEGVKKEMDGEISFHFRIDVLWSYIADMKITGSNAKRLKFLSKLAEINLIILHSNAELERLFSIVKKNKSLERSSMKLGGTLSSILAIKTLYPESNTPCYSWKPTEEVLESSKKATNKYNEEHK